MPEACCRPCCRRWRRRREPCSGAASASGRFWRSRRHDRTAGDLEEHRGLLRPPHCPYRYNKPFQNTQRGDLQSRSGPTLSLVLILVHDAASRLLTGLRMIVNTPALHGRRAKMSLSNARARHLAIDVTGKGRYTEIMYRHELRSDATASVSPVFGSIMDLTPMERA